tara:strand:- start:541 stop:1314 length:774 start_codon:yes stop_codon:yes gene_type:complete
MKVIVIGDTCIDEYVYCSTKRFCPDAPVPVIKPLYNVKSLGMAGNVADNLGGLGIKTKVISNTERIKKVRYVDDRTNHMFIRVDKEADDITPLSWEVLEAINFKEYDGVVVSDYNKGFISNDQLRYIGENSKVSIMDSKRILTDKIVETYTFVKLNESEKKLNSNLISNNIITTLGSNGAIYQGKHFTVEEVAVRDTSGAGDSFVAGFVYNYLRTSNVWDSIDFANKCATQVVQKKGTAKIDIKEIKDKSYINEYKN